MRSLEQTLTPQQFEILLHKEDIKLALRNYLTHLLEYKQLPQQENSLEVMRKRFVLEKKLEVAQTLLTTILAAHHELHLEYSQEQEESDQSIIFVLNNWSASNLELLVEVVDHTPEVGTERTHHQTSYYF